MARILRSKLARADLRDVWLYIAQDNIDATDRLLERIDHTVRTIAERPEIGESRDDLKQGLRRGCRSRRLRSRHCITSLPFGRDSDPGPKGGAAAPLDPRLGWIDRFAV